MTREAAATVRLPGFADAVLDAQATFRAVLAAMAHPGRIEEIAAAPEAPAPLSPAAGAVLLALADLDAPVWLDDTLAADEVAAWLRFHTGATIISEPRDASFAAVGALDRVDGFETFSVGTAEYPDRSTTVIAEVEDLEGGTPLTLSGPGIDEARRFAPESLGAGFVAAWRANRALFPLGVDLVLTCGNRVAALPRSVMIEEEASRCTSP